MSVQDPPRRGVFTAIIGILAFSVISGILVTALVAPAIAVVSVGAQSGIGIFNNLPTYIEIGTQAAQNKIYAKSNGKEVQIATIFKQNRQEVGWDDVSQYAKDAAVDGEDRRFYSHGGVDPTGVVRAIINNASGASTQGASTIAQQLVKNILIQNALQIQKSTPAATLAAQKAGIAAAQATTLNRKLKEIKLAISLEKKYTKDQVLLAYLNIAGFNGTTYGIESAAERYYGIHAKDLDIVQSATIMAIVQKPTARAPINEAGYAQNTIRRNHILQAMEAAGDITKAQSAAAQAVVESPKTVKNISPNNGCIAAANNAKWFCDYVTKLIPELTSLGATKSQRTQAWDRGGYDLYTTLNLDLAAVAQRTVSQFVPAYTPQLNLGGASTSVEMGTGRIITMAENKKFDNTLKGGGNSASAVNLNTNYAYGGSGGFQGGSTYKAFTLIDWLKNGHGLNEYVNGNARTVNQRSFADTCPDGPFTGPYRFQNDAGQTRGPVSVMTATAASINAGFISMAQQLDLCDIRNVAMSLGVRTASIYTNPFNGVVGDAPMTNPSSVLGTNLVSPLTMAAAYAGIGNHGTYCAPIAIDSITSPAHERLPGQAKHCAQAIPTDIADAAVFALQGPLGGGPAGGAGTGAASNPRDGTAVFGKTGTTNNSLQSWVVGGNSKVATAVWVGNIQGSVPLRATYIPGVGNASVIRHQIFPVIERAIDSTYHPAATFPSPNSSLLNGSGTKVPNVIGQSTAAATSMLQASGFTVRVGNPVSSPLAKGAIARVSPGVGSMLSPGYQITIYPSDGALMTVPSVIGQGNTIFAEAKTILNNAGFTNIAKGCAVVDPASNKAGFAVSTSPPAGTVAKPSTPIVVNIGQTTVCTPDGGNGDGNGGGGNGGGG
jgi:membrane peptidoglycan carboxypeptidase